MSPPVSTSDAGASAPDDSTSQTTLTAADVDAVARLRAFASDHGGGAVAVVEYVGRVGARIVVIAPDGAFGDAMASSVPAGVEVCRRADIPIRSWDRELTSLITPQPADRVRMAGTGR